MSWKGVTVMDQRIRFIAEYLEGYFPFNELCIQFSISRKTGYKWVQRYENHGEEGLTDQSRRPHFCPHEALEMKTPSSAYVSSPRRTPTRIEHYYYAAHFEVRRVSRNSGIRWRHRWVQVSSTLAEEYIGFEEIEDGIYNVYFCEVLIGMFFDEVSKIKDVIERVPFLAI
jgi:transposase-like protein